MRVTNMTIAQSTGFFREWCIAGGFATCPGLAEDCDVWVLGVEDGRTERQMLLGALNRLRVPHIEEQNDESNPTEFYDIGAGVLCWKVAKLTDGSRRQIILTNAPTIQGLLENFDVSTHQCALSSDGEFVAGSHHTLITELPVQLRAGTMTEARMKKIAARYAAFYTLELPETGLSGQF